MGYQRGGRKLAHICLGSTTAIADRRNDQRHVTVLKAGVLHYQGRKQLCLVKNISSGGLNIKLYSTLQTGAEVGIELRPNELLRSSVTWRDEANYGLTFAHRVDVEALLGALWVAEPHHRPRLPRMPANSSCRVRLGSRVQTAQLIDISPGGVALSVEIDLAVGAEVVLSIPALPALRGVVRWTSGRTAGLSFIPPLKFEVIARWLSGRSESPADGTNQAHAQAAFSLADANLGV